MAFFNNQRSSLPALSYADSLAASSADIVLLIGRIMVGWIFVRSGYGKMFMMDAVAQGYATRGIPLVVGYASIPIEFFGGLALIFGFATRYAAIVMAVFTVVATLTSHRYWDFTEVAARRAQETNFFKNVAILGGLFLLFVCGAGRLSLDNWLSKRG